MVQPINVNSAIGSPGSRHQHFDSLILSLIWVFVQFVNECHLCIGACSFRVHLSATPNSIHFYPYHWVLHLLFTRSFESLSQIKLLHLLHLWQVIVHLHSAALRTPSASTVKTQVIV